MNIAHLALSLQRLLQIFMKNEQLKPDYIFETSWEVCNKVGGIYTVLSSRAKTLMSVYQDKLVFIGPDLKQPTANVDFCEDEGLLPTWKKAAADLGLKCRIGRWNVPGKPVAVLVDFAPLLKLKTRSMPRHGISFALTHSTPMATMMRHRCFRMQPVALLRPWCRSA